MNVTKCEGNGQGSCKRCLDNGKCNLMWMCFLYHIEGYEGSIVMIVLKKY